MLNILKILLSKTNRIRIHIIVILLFVFIAILNMSQSGYMIAMGDFFQYYNIEENLFKYRQAWGSTPGQGTYNTLSSSYPYHLYLGFVEYIFKDPAIVGAVWMITFFTLSYFGMYICLKNFNTESHNLKRSILAFFYSINPITSMIFVYSWGYTHHVLIYLSLPYILYIFFNFTQKDSTLYKKIVLFSSVMLFSFICNNLAFYILTVTSLTGITALYVIFNYNDSQTKKFLRRAFYFIFSYILTHAFTVLLPFFMSTSYISSKLKDDKVYGDLLGFIKLTSSTSFDVLSLTSSGIETFNTPLYFFIGIGIIYLIIKYLFDRKHTQNKMYLVFVSMLVLLLTTAVRLTPPFDTLFINLYNLPLIGGLLRSSDKIVFLIPSIFIIIFYMTVDQIVIKVKKVYILFLILLFVIIYPFFGGTLYKYHTKYQQDFYRRSIEIPTEYITISKKISKDENKHKSIISLPYSVVNSINWSNYETWGFLGQDILVSLFNNNYISANTFDHNGLQTKFIFKEINDNKKSTSKELLTAIQKFSGGYLLYHKDITSNWKSNTKHIESLVIDLETQGILKKIDSNLYFDFYTLDETYWQPLINSSTNMDMTYAQISPNMYTVEIKGLKNRQLISLNQSYNPQWLLKYNHSNNPCEISQKYKSTSVCKDSFFDIEKNIYEVISIMNSGEINEAHYMSDDYKNTWVLDRDYIFKHSKSAITKINEDGSIDVKFDIVFQPQIYNLLFQFFYIISILNILIYFIIKKSKKK